MTILQTFCISVPFVLGALLITLSVIVVTDKKAPKKLRVIACLNLFAVLVGVLLGACGVFG